MASARRDVVVVGAGHNSLVAACLLARAGLDVEVVERDTVVGGAVSTVERWPGHRVDRGSSLHVMIRRTGIIEQLDLAGVGLRYLDVDPWGFVPMPTAPGGGVLLWHDLERTCASIREACGPVDAAGYRALVEAWGERALRLLDVMGRPGASALRDGRELGGRARDWLGSGDALLARHLTDERLVGGLAWLGAQAGPPTHRPGSAALVGWNTALHTLTPGRPVGGSGRLTEALAARLLSDGGSVRLGDGAAQVVSGGGRVTGVRTHSGDLLEADAVVAGCHISHLLAISGAEHAWLGRRVDVGTGMGMVVRVVTDALPRWSGAPADAWAGMQLLCGSRGRLRAAWADSRAGRSPCAPPVLVMTPTHTDPTLAPAGRHVITLWSQWHPHAGTEDAAAEPILDAVEAAAPGFRASVRAVHVQTPRELERELALPVGNVMHVDMTLRASFGGRPTRRLGGHRGPLDGLYRCGASTAPGGGVWGASGRTAATLLLEDLGLSGAAA